MAPMIPEKNMRILIVDDEEPITRLLQHVFEALRPTYEVSVVRDGQAALGQQQRHSFDLAIVDDHLQSMKGLDLAYHLRQHWPGTQVIIIGGNLPVDITYHVKLLGLAGYLRKPFTPKQLLEVVDRALVEYSC